jgi:prenyltransferase beta subunit
MTIMKCLQLASQAWRIHECSCKHLMMVVWPKHGVQRERRICCLRRYPGKSGLICSCSITKQQMQATKCISCMIMAICYESLQNNLWRNF